MRRRRSMGAQSGSLIKCNRCGKRYRSNNSKHIDGAQCRATAAWNLATQRGLHSVGKTEAELLRRYFDVPTMLLYTSWIKFRGGGEDICGAWWAEAWAAEAIMAVRRYKQVCASTASLHSICTKIKEKGLLRKWNPPPLPHKVLSVVVFPKPQFVLHWAKLLGEDQFAPKKKSLWKGFSGTMFGADGNIYVERTQDIYQRLDDKLANAIVGASLLTNDHNFPGLEIARWWLDTNGGKGHD